MNVNEIKRKIYVRVFCALFAVYLLLMAGFSGFLLWQEKQAEGKELGLYTLQVSNGIWRALQENMNADGTLKDIAAVKRALVGKTYSYSEDETALAVYSGDLKLLSNTGDYWLCCYTERTEGNTSYTAYGYLDPKKWFDKKEIKELESYIYYQSKAKKRGELAEYSLSIMGLWLDNEMIIPDKISVTPMYASTFDEDGNLSSSSGTDEDRMIYETGYVDKRGLPYFKYGSIQPASTYRGVGGQSKLRSAMMDEGSQSELNRIVADQSRLKKALQNPLYSTVDRVGPFTYRYYTVMPYQSMATVDDRNNLHSEAWTVSARDVNLLDRCGSVLLFLWMSCFAAFLTASLILSAQIHKTYAAREAAENYRKEMTKALAHDLKTPLSIISGYAQNLMENIRTEKREKYAAGIQINTERMDKIIREMLELSKLESGRAPRKGEAVSLNRICTELMDRYCSVCEERAIVLSLTGDSLITADPSLLERVIDNFFVNALEFTPEGGEVRIMIQEGTLEFYNSGSSIPEGKTEEIWMPYTRLDSSRGSKGSTGLGLAIAGSILKSYGFSYGAKNQDSGVLFWFTFPAAKE